jgi:hypothetical protein
VRARNPIYCRELAARLRASLGVPENEGRVLASLLVSGGAATLSEVAALSGTSLGDADAGRSRLLRRGALESSMARTCDLAPTAASSPRRRPLARLRTAYLRGGLPAVREEHVRSTESHLAYRRTAFALERLCPLKPILELGAELEAMLYRESFPVAANALLSRLPDRWEIDLPPGARERLREAPLVVFGNHPSMLTPFLVAAALERDDLRVLAHRYVTTLIPGLSPYVLPLEPTHATSTWARILSGPSHLLSFSALRRLDLLVSEDEARRTNRESLCAGIKHVQGGGALAIFPDGGRPGGRWYPGLGRILLELKKTREDAWLVPVCEENCTNRRVYRALRWKRRICVARSIRFLIAEPISTGQFAVPDDATPDVAVALLRSAYDRAEWRAASG